MEIRAFEAKDLDNVATLFVQSFNAPPWNDAWQYEDAYRRLEDIVRTNRFIGVVAMEDSEVMGAILGHLEYWYEGNHYNLREIFVSQKAQGRGIGSQMLEVLDSLLSDQEVNEIVLLTLDTQETVKFYEKNRFSKSKSIVIMHRN